MARRKTAGRRASRPMPRWATTTRTTYRKTPTFSARSAWCRRRASNRSRPVRPSPASLRLPPGRSSGPTACTAHENYQAKCYRVEPVPGTDQYIAYIAYDLDLFEEGSIANLTSSIIGNVFGFKALKSLRLEDMRIPPHYAKTFQGPPHGIVMEREYLNKYGRPLLGATVKPKLGLSARNYGRVVYEALRGGLDFTKDDENINSQPFMRWRDRFLFAMEAVQQGDGRDRRDQGPLHERHRRHHGGHVRARRVCQGDWQRDHHDRPDDRLHGHPVDGEVGAQERPDPAPASRRARHLYAPEDARRQLPRDRQVDAAGGRGSHPRRARWSASWRAIRTRCAATTTPCARTSWPPTRCRACTSSRTGLRCRRRCPSLRAASTPARCTSCCTTWARTVVLQFGGGTIGHPDGIAEGAAANRVAVEAMIQARNEGRDYLNEGPEILAQRRALVALAAARRSKMWKDITFDFESTDVPDVVADAHTELLAKSTGRRPMRITQGTFSYLPDLTDDQIKAADAVLPGQRLAGVGGVHRRPAPAQHLLGDVGPARCSTSKDPAAVMLEVDECRRGLSRPLHPRQRLRPPPRARDHRAELHRQPPEGRARLSGWNGRSRSDRQHQVHHPLLCDRQARGPSATDPKR